MTTWQSMTRDHAGRAEVEAYRHSETGRAVLRSLVPVICPVEAAGCAEAIVDHVALTLGAAPLLVRKGFGAGLLAYDLGALPRFRRRARLLTGECAVRYYDSWALGITPLHRQFAHALNQLVSLACYEQPEMTARIGYAPAPWIEEVTKKRLTVFSGDVRAQAAQIIAPDPLRPGVFVGRRKQVGG